MQLLLKNHSIIIQFHGQIKLIYNGVVKYVDQRLAALKTKLGTSPNATSLQSQETSSQSTGFKAQEPQVNSMIHSLIEDIQVAFE